VVISILDPTQLFSWLGLAPGPWPPDHYSLLGLPPGHADADSFEPRVLQQMDRLRIHQLLHPELVTEGMNRLAQALITLTDPTAKTAYDSELGVAIAAPPSPPAKPRTEAVSESVVVAEVLSFEDDGPEPPATEVTQEIVLPAEILPKYELVPEASKPPRARPRELPAVRPYPTPPSSRRWIYRRLAEIRRGRRAWLKLRPVFLDPLDPLDRPGRLLILLEGTSAIRPLLPSLAGVVGGLDDPGGLVATMIRQSLLLDTIRRLLPDQRQRLAADWRQGLLELDREYDRLRQLSREERSRAEGVPNWPLAIRWVRDVPELLLVTFAALILLVSLIRSQLAPSP